MKLVLGPIAGWAQQRDGLSLMTSQTSQNIVELVHRVDDVGAYVQRHALGALSHGGVGDLGPRGSFSPRELVEEFSGPDDRQVGGFGQPKDYFPQLHQLCVAHLCGEVPTRDHHAHRRKSCPNRSKVKERTHTDPASCSPA